MGPTLLAGTTPNEALYKEINNLLNANEITGPDLAARARYCFGRDFEGLYEEYLLILKKVGVKLT